MTEYLLRLSWPHPCLSSNSRAHWSKVAKATAAYRREAYGEGLVRLLHKDPNPKAHLYFHFYPPDRRKRDPQNMPHMMKAIIDGIADAMNCDELR